MPQQEVKEELKIPLNKSRFGVIFLLSMAFVLVALWMIIDNVMAWLTDDKVTSAPLSGALFILAVFTVTAIFAWFRIKNTHYGLILNAEGVTDLSSITSLGLIPWQDIEAVSIVTVSQHQLMKVKLRNPSHYVDHRRYWIRMLRQMNIRNHGSPCLISSSALNITFDELQSSFNSYLEHYHSDTQKQDS